MAGPKFTQKQIAEKYKGNLAYFKKPHYLRRIRLWTFVLAVVLSVGGLLTFHFWGKSEFLTTGPISENHASIAADCQTCHLGADTNLLKSLFSHGPKPAIVPASLTTPGQSAGMMDLAQKGLGLTSLGLMDQACLKCHDAMGLHQPQSAALALRTVGTQLSLVHAVRCAVCHREHVGHERMALPSSQTCADCHNDASRLASAHQTIKLDNPPIAPAGETRDLGDGLLRFFPPVRTAGLPTFATYADAHPPFGYEQPNLRDPGKLKFNHARHERDDLPKINGRALTCTDCHRPGSDGTFYQRISYEQACQQCHSLQIQPNLPKVLIPHGDPQKVRYFLASLRMSFSENLRADGVTDAVDLDRQTTREMDTLRARGLNTLDDLEERVFFTGDPRADKSDRIAKGTPRKFLTECAKCHTVSPGTAQTPPAIAPVNQTDRWIQHGPFTHRPHNHMDCADCHGEAHKSKLTSDILLPPQKLCAECHRPLDQAKVAPTDDRLKLQAVLQPGSHELAAAQRRAGGVRSDCQACHVFHAPPAATALLQPAAK